MQQDNTMADSKIENHENTNETKAHESTIKSFSQTHVNAATNDAKTGLWSKLTGHTHAYLAEYAVLMIVLSSLLGVTNGLFAGIIDSFNSGDQQTWYLSGKWAYTSSLSGLAAVIAFVPLLLLLSRRTRGTELDNPDIKNTTWRKGFLGLFLVGLGTTVVCYSVGLAYVIVSAFSNVGLAVETDNKIWQALVKNIFAITVFGFSALLYARDYRVSQNNVYSTWRRVHRYAVVVLAVVVAGVFLFVPLTKQRGAYVDDLVVGDLQSIISKVSSYGSKNSKLPAQLSDLELSDAIKARISSQKYEYKKTSNNTYEICATFKTDRSEKQSELFGFGNSDYDSSSDQQSPSRHEKGRQCFKQTVSSIGGSSRSNRGSIDDYYNNYYDDFDYEN